MPLLGIAAAQLGLGKPQSAPGTQREAATGRADRAVLPGDSVRVPLHAALSAHLVHIAARRCEQADGAQLAVAGPAAPSGRELVGRARAWPARCALSCPFAVLPHSRRPRVSSYAPRSFLSTAVALAAAGAGPPGGTRPIVFGAPLIHAAGATALAPLKLRRLCRRFSWPSWVRRTVSQNRPAVTCPATTRWSQAARGSKLNAGWHFPPHRSLAWLRASPPGLSSQRSRGAPAPGPATDAGAGPDVLPCSAQATAQRRPFGLSDDGVGVPHALRAAPARRLRRAERSA
ncbi:hypothetical protein B0J12DRAFT_698380 [Macrophomina phaseolina]|uniref:Uncharacterized protein n=1 Tax=Macrophomina phaseolina TaxID=35725 RepID=A0ABQ8GE12_9PEZI|nr:hypothetical protein B0J12DRAFT_698380 [Macrophomina phaseolina]